MKLTYRDKIVAAILIAIAILLIGFFALIRPTINRIKDDKAIRTTRMAEKEKTENTIAQIPGLKENIINIYTDTTNTARVFVPREEVKDTAVIDQTMQDFADKTKVTLKSVELANSTLAPIDYYYEATSDTFVDLRKSADVNGDLQTEYDASVAESTSLTQRAKESIIQTQYGIKVEGTKKNIYDYLEELKNYDKAMVINSVAITDYTFGKKAADDAKVSLPDSKDGEKVEVSAGEGQKITNTSEAQIVITLYSVYDMPEPNVEAN